MVLAKYCMNHPSRFRGSKSQDKNGNEVIDVTRVFPPFFVAICQVFVGLIVEINILIYLTSMKEMLDIIMRFVALMSVINFDNMYVFVAILDQACFVAFLT